MAGHDLIAGQDFRHAGHLPNLRPGGRPASPLRLPRQRKGTTPQMRGRYPDHDVLSQAAHWDEATRRVVMKRVERVPPIRFFTRDEARTLRAFCDLLTAQDREPRIPVLEIVDEKLFEGQLDGYRYADMPDDRETWRRAAAGLDAAARQHSATTFAGATLEVQRQVIQAFAGARLHGEVWDELPPRHAWSVVTRAVLAAFYSHPWAWNEIGFGGPAYPRGYARIGAGQRESWEGAAASDADPAGAGGAADGTDSASAGAREGAE